MLNKEVILTRLTNKGDSVSKVKVKTLVKEKFNTVPFTTIVNGKVIYDWGELLDECNKEETPQVLQTPIVVGG